MENQQQSLYPALDEMKSMIIVFFIIGSQLQVLVNGSSPFSCPPYVLLSYICTCWFSYSSIFVNKKMVKFWRVTHIQSIMLLLMLISVPLHLSMLQKLLVICRLDYIPDCEIATSPVLLLVTYVRVVSGSPLCNDPLVTFGFCYVLVCSASLPLIIRYQNNDIVLYHWVEFCRT